MRVLRTPVEHACTVLSDSGIQFSSRAYRGARNRPPSARSVEDARIVGVLEGLRTPGEEGKRAPELLYGVRKMWKWLQRLGFLNVARCTVERLMKRLGTKGLVRGKTKRTTVPGKNGKRAGDRLNRISMRITRTRNGLPTSRMFVPGLGSCMWLSSRICTRGESGDGPHRQPKMLFLLKKPSKW